MRYKAKRIIIKVFPEITLVFYDEKSIYAITEGDKYTSVFHNWVAPRFTYRDHWLPFKKALLKRRFLDKHTCWQLAYDYQVPYKTSTDKIILDNKEVEIRYKRWSVTGILNGMS